MESVSQAAVSEVYYYDDSVGALRYKVKAAQRVNIGDIAGAVNDKGYIQIRLGGSLHRAHRLIWLLHNGTTPAFIDHIDGNKANNRISNLRAATRNQNGANIPKSKGAQYSSVWKGVSWNKRQRKWQAKLGARKAQDSIFLGYFTHAEDAAMAYNEALLTRFGAFALLNEAPQ